MIRRNMEELDCAYSQMKSLAINTRYVDKCITDQFEIPGDIESSDSMLEADALEQAEKGIYLHPGLAINGITYRGYLEGEDIHNAVCASFTQKPDACRNQIEELFENIENQIEAILKQDALNEERVKRHNIREAKRVRKGIVWGVLGFLLVGQIVAFLWYKKRRTAEVNNRMRSSVDTAVAEYMRVGAEDTNNDESSDAAGQKKSNQDAIA